MQCVPGSPGFSCVCGVWVLGYVHPQPLNPPPVLDSTAVMCSALRSTYSRHTVHTQYTSKKNMVQVSHVQYSSKNISTSIPFCSLETEQNRTEQNGMVGHVQLNAHERFRVCFMVMPVHTFESKPLVMSRYWYATHAPYDTILFRWLKRKKMEWNEKQLVTVLFHAVTTHYSQQALIKYHI